MSFAVRTGGTPAPPQHLTCMDIQICLGLGDFMSVHIHCHGSSADHFPQRRVWSSSETHLCTMTHIHSTLDRVFFTEDLFTRFNHTELGVIEH